MIKLGGGGAFPRRFMGERFLFWIPVFMAVAAVKRAYFFRLFLLDGEIF